MFYGRNEWASNARLRLDKTFLGCSFFFSFTTIIFYRCSVWFLFSWFFFFSNKDNSPIPGRSDAICQSYFYLFSLYLPDFYFFIFSTSTFFLYIYRCWIIFLFGFYLSIPPWLLMFFGLFARVVLCFSSASMGPIHWTFKSFLNMLRSFFYKFYPPILSRGSRNKKNLLFSKALLDSVIEFFLRSHPISCLFGQTPGYCLLVSLE